MKKRLVSWILALCMILSLLPMTVFASESVIYFDNTSYRWNAVYAYFYGDTTSTAYPGTEMTPVDGQENLYSCSIPDGYSNVFFHNYAGGQTINLTLPTDDKIVYEPTTAQWLTYEEATATSPTPDYTVILAGTPELTGANWSTDLSTYPENILTNTDGTIYSITKENVPVGTHEFKVVCVDDETGAMSWYGTSGGQNIVFSVTQTCDVTIQFNSETHEITYLGDYAEEPKIAIDCMCAVGTAYGGFLNDSYWDPAAEQNMMTEVSPYVWEISYPNVSAGHYEVKFAANWSWSLNWGATSDGFTAEGTFDLAHTDNNIHFDLESDSAVTLRIDLSNYDSDTGLGAKGTIEIAPAIICDHTSLTDQGYCPDCGKQYAFRRTDSNGKQFFDTIEDAFSGADADAVILMLKDYDEYFDVVTSGGILDLGGNTLSRGLGAVYYFQVLEGGSLTVQNGLVHNGMYCTGTVHFKNITQTGEPINAYCEVEHPTYGRIPAGNLLFHSGQYTSLVVAYAPSEVEEGAISAAPGKAFYDEAIGQYLPNGMYTYSNVTLVEAPLQFTAVSASAAQIYETESVTLTADMLTTVGGRVLLFCTSDNTIPGEETIVPVGSTQRTVELSGLAPGTYTYLFIMGFEQEQTYSYTLNSETITIEVLPCPHETLTDGTCDACGRYYEAKVTANGSTTYYASLSEAWDYALTVKSTITLLTDVTVADGLYSGQWCNITLDLNGKHLNCGQSNITLDAPETSGSDLVIFDSSAEGTGIVLNDLNTPAIVLGSHGYVIFNGGKIVKLSGHAYGLTIPKDKVLINADTGEYHSDDELTYDFTLALADHPIQIIQQPEGISAKVGDTCTLEVVAEGDNLTYEWWTTDKSLGVLGTDPVLTIDTSAPLYYSVYCKISNGEFTRTTDYAPVKIVQVYTVTYDANGGTGSVPTDATHYEEGSTVTALFDPLPTRQDYVFIGWSREPASNEPEFGIYNDTFTITENTTLYACWEKYSQTHCGCGKSDCTDASHTEVLYDTLWRGDLDAQNISSDCNIVLTGDATLADLTVSSGSTLNLCLNGYTLTLSDFAILSDGSVLNICDCSAEQSGIITCGDTITIYVTNNCTLNLYGGKVENTMDGQSDVIHTYGTTNIYGGIVYSVGSHAIAATASPGVVNVYSGRVESASAYAISNSWGSTLNIYGGTITGNDSYCVISNSGTAYIYGGTIENKNSVTDACNTIHNGQNGNLTISGGTITGSSWSAVNNSSSGICTVTAGNIIASGDYGIYSNGTLNFSGGNVVGGVDAAIYNFSGTLSMTGGQADSEGYYGIISNGTMHLSGGSITGGINDALHISKGSIYLSGEPYVESFMAYLSSVTIYGHAMDDVTDTYQGETLCIGIGGSEYVTGNILVYETTDVGRYSLDHTDWGYELASDGTNIVLQMQHTWSETYSSDETAHWYDCVASECDITDNSQKKGYELHTAPTDDGNCNTAVTCKTCGYVFVEAMEHNFTDSTDTDCNNEGCSYTHAIPADDGDCTTALVCETCNYEFLPSMTSHSFADAEDTTCDNEGCTYTHTKPADDGNCSTGLVCETCGYVFAEGIPHSFTDDEDTDCNNEGCTYIRVFDHTHTDSTKFAAVNGDIIGSGNYYLAEDRTTVLQVSGDAVLCLNGHSISSDSEENPFGILVTDNANLTICDCHAGTEDEPAGSVNGLALGIYNAGTGTITVNNGTVSGMYVGIDGEGGTTVLNGGTVTGITDYYGGTIIVNGGTVTGDGIGTESGTVTINGGTINSGNDGIYLNLSTLTIYGGSIYGDLYGINSTESTVTIEDGTISAGNYGIYDYMSTITINGGSVSGYYDGIDCDSSVLTINGGSIVGPEYGIYDYAYSEITINGGTITNNRYGIYVFRSKLTITDGTITCTFNEENDTCYAIYDDYHSEVIIDGGTITSDTYGIYSCAGSITINGGTITGGKDGIQADGSVLTITDGSINGVQTGIYDYDGSEISISGGKIIADTVGIECCNSNLTITGGSISSEGSSILNTGSKVCLSGTPVLIGNIKCSDSIEMYAYTETAEGVRTDYTGDTVCIHLASGDTWEDAVVVYGSTDTIKFVLANPEEHEGYALCPVDGNLVLMLHTHEFIEGECDCGAKASYTVIWVDDEGKELLTVEDVPYGTAIDETFINQCTAPTYENESLGYYHYEPQGWSCDFTAVTEDNIQIKYLCDVYIQQGVLPPTATEHLQMVYYCLDKDAYYYDPIIYTDDFLYIASDLYYLNSDGYAVTGLLRYVTDSGEVNYYYFDPVTCVAFRASEGNDECKVEQTNGLSLIPANYKFDADGVICHFPDTSIQGIYFDEASGNYYDCVDGVIQARGLFERDGNYYYASTSTGALVCNRFYYITSTASVPELRPGKYYFNEQCQLIMEGFIEQGGKLYFLKNGKISYGGLFLYEGNYYYARTSTGEIIRNRSYWITVTNGLPVKSGSYAFDADGKMIIPEPKPVKDGIVEENGKLYHYENGKLSYAGLIEIDGNYYYVRTSTSEVICGRSYWVTVTNGLPIKAGQYYFDETGKMIP